MKRLVVGVLGHVDHGKTALVKMLTGHDTDRLPEEKQRGISIALGFAHLKLSDGTVIDLIDMPGHERFVRTMIAGATGIDGVLLVVAANEGIQPQTIEHVQIAALLGVTRAVVAITKLDMVDLREARHVAARTLQLLKQSGLDAVASVTTSTANKVGAAELCEALLQFAETHRERASDGHAYLPIDRAFAIKGHGPVVTGTLRGASLTIDDALELLPSRKSMRVRMLQVHGERVDSASPGQRVALNLRDVEIAELKHGMALATPGSLAVSDWLTVSLRSVDNAPPLKNGSKLRALAGTDEVDVRLRLLDRDVLESGDTALAQLRCERSIASPCREHVILRVNSPSTTVAGGKILETATRRLKRHDHEILKRLADLQSLPIPALIEAEVKRLSLHGAALKHLSQLTALSTRRIETILKTLPVVSTHSGLVIWKPALDKLLPRISAALASHEVGLSQKSLADNFPKVSKAVMDEALVCLLARGEVSQRNNKFLLQRHRNDTARSNRESELAEQIARKLLSSGLTPPSPADIVVCPETKRAVDRLLKEHTIVRAVDRDKGKELLFHRDAIEAAQRKLAPLLDGSTGMLVTEIAAALGISRKYCMPLLDQLDAIRFTRRINDRRVRA